MTVVMTKYNKVEFDIKLFTVDKANLLPLFSHNKLK